MAREIEGELVIVPLTAGIGNLEDELYTLNETGKQIWKMLDGKKNLRAIADQLQKEYEVRESEIMEDLTGFVQELLKRRMLVEAVGR